MYNVLIAFAALCLIVLIFRKRYLIMVRDQLLTTPKALPKELTAAYSPGTTASSGTDLAEEEANNQPLRHGGQAPVDFSEINRTFRIGDMHFLRNELEEAEKCFIKVLSLYEQHEEALNRLGVIYIQLQQPYKAELLYRKLLAYNKREPVYYSNFGRCLYNQKKHAAAIAAYEAALALDQNRAARFISLGQILYEAGKYAKALEYFLQAHKLEPKNLEYLELIADLYEFFGDIANMELFLKKILEIDPYNKIAGAKLEKIAREKPQEPPLENDNQQPLL